MDKVNLLGVTIESMVRVLENSNNSQNQDAFTLAAEATAEKLNDGGTVYFVGNGGSAADAQHLAAELVGRMRVDRPPLRGVALTTDSSVLTALVNDYDPLDVFLRQVQAFVTDKDVLVAISTSGSSENVVRAARLARSRGCLVVSMTGGLDCPLDQVADISLKIASQETPLVQVGHILFGQALLEAAERRFLV